MFGDTGPTTDRLGVSNNQLTVLTAVFTNHGGGDIDEIALSKSTCRRSRTSARAHEAEDIRNNLQCTVGQMKFDGKLLLDLGVFEKVKQTCCCPCAGGGFDTTASNSGVHKGACTILQELLQRQLLACMQTPHLGACLVSNIPGTLWSHHPPRGELLRIPQTSGEFPGPLQHYPAQNPCLLQNRRSTRPSLHQPLPGTRQQPPHH